MFKKWSDISILPGNIQTSGCYHRASKIIRVDLRDHSFDGLGPEISWVKGGPGKHGGGWGSGQSGAPLSPGGECFAPCCKIMIPKWLEELAVYDLVGFSLISLH